MKAITIYLKGIEPYLVTQSLELSNKDQNDEVQKERSFIDSLLKEIAELPALEQGE